MDRTTGLVVIGRDGGGDAVLGERQRRRDDVIGQFVGLVHAAGYQVNQHDHWLSLNLEEFRANQFVVFYRMFPIDIFDAIAGLVHAVAVKLDMLAQAV